MNKIFDKDLIQINVEADDREEAIKKSAFPLVKKNKITNEYVDSIIKVMKEIGPYFVLIPHVALPHARPEEGAIENSIGISVLRDPVNFFSEENDPIKYIFVMSAIDNEEHLNTLQVLSSLIEDENFFSVLDNASNTDDIYNYIKNK